MSLSRQEIKDKICMVETDLENLRNNSSSDKKLSILSEYRDYLKDELKLLDQSQQDTQ